MDPNDPQLAQLAQALLLQALPKGGGDTATSQKEQLQSLLQQLQGSQQSKQPLPQHLQAQTALRGHGQAQAQAQPPRNLSPLNRRSLQQGQQGHGSLKRDNQELVSQVMALLGAKDGAAAGEMGAAAVGQSPPSLGMMRQGSSISASSGQSKHGPGMAHNADHPPQQKPGHQGQHQQMHDFMAALLKAADQGKQQQHQQHLQHRRGDDAEMVSQIMRMLDGAQAPQRSQARQAPQAHSQNQQVLLALQQLLGGRTNHQQGGRGTASAIAALLGSLGEGGGGGAGQPDLGQLLMLVAKASKEKLSDVDRALLELALCQSLISSNTGSPKPNTPASPSSHSSGGASDPLAMLLPAIASKLLQQRGSQGRGGPSQSQGYSQGPPVTPPPFGAPVGQGQNVGQGSRDTAGDIARIIMMEASAVQGTKPSRSQESSGSVGRGPQGQAEGAPPVGLQGGSQRSGGNSPVSMRSGDVGAGNMSSGPHAHAAQGSNRIPGSRSVSSAGALRPDDSSPGAPGVHTPHGVRGEGGQQERSQEPHVDLLQQLLLQQQGDCGGGGLHQGQHTPHTPEVPRPGTGSAVHQSHAEQRMPDQSGAGGGDQGPKAEHRSPGAPGIMEMETGMEDLGDIDCSDWINDDMSMLPTPRPHSAMLEVPKTSPPPDVPGLHMNPAGVAAGEQRDQSAAAHQVKAEPLEGSLLESEPGAATMQVERPQDTAIHMQSLTNFDLTYDRSSALERSASNQTNSICPSPSIQASPRSLPRGGPLSGPHTLSSPQLAAVTEAMSGVASWVERSGPQHGMSPSPGGPHGGVPEGSRGPSSLKGEPWIDLPKTKWPEGLELLPLDTPIGELPLGDHVYENSGKKSRTSLGPIRTSSSSGSLGDPEAWKAKGSPSLAGSSPGGSMTGLPPARSSPGFGPGSASPQGSEASDRSLSPGPRSPSDSQGMEDVRARGGGGVDGPGDEGEGSNRGGGSRTKGRGRGSFRRRSQSPAPRKTDGSPNMYGMRAPSPGRKRAWGEDSSAEEGGPEPMSLSQLQREGSFISRTSSGGSDLGACDGPGAEGAEDNPTIVDMGRSKTVPSGLPRGAGAPGGGGEGGGGKASGQAQGSDQAKKPRQKRGTATDPHSVAARMRRDKISQRMKLLYELVPNAKSGDTATMLDEAIRYVRHLQDQVQNLSKDKEGGSGSTGAGPSGSGGGSPQQGASEAQDASYADNPSAGAESEDDASGTREGFAPGDVDMLPGKQGAPDSYLFAPSQQDQYQAPTQGEGQSTAQEEGASRGALPPHVVAPDLPKSMSLSSWQGSDSPKHVLQGERPVEGSALRLTDAGSVGEHSQRLGTGPGASRLGSGAHHLRAAGDSAEGQREGSEGGERQQKWGPLHGEIELAMEDISISDLDVTDAPGWGF